MASAPLPRGDAIFLSTTGEWKGIKGGEKMRCQQVLCAPEVVIGDRGLLCHFVVVAAGKEESRRSSFVEPENACVGDRHVLILECVRVYVRVCLHGEWCMGSLWFCGRQFEPSNLLLSFTFPFWTAILVYCNAFKTSFLPPTLPPFLDNLI